MIAFHGKQEIKEKYLARVRAHREADELIHGTYWVDGRGCAVGCTIHGSQHWRYEHYLGIPGVLAHIEDSCFERMPVADAQNWPEQFLSAIPVGADLSRVYDRLILWAIGPGGLLPDTPELAEPVRLVQAGLSRVLAGDRPSGREWRAIRNGVLADTPVSAADLRWALSHIVEGKLGSRADQCYALDLLVYIPARLRHKRVMDVMPLDGEQALKADISQSYLRLSRALLELLTQAPILEATTC